MGAPLWNAKLVSSVDKGWPADKVERRSAAQLALVRATGFSGIASTSGGVALSVAQTLALEGVALKVSVPIGQGLRSQTWR